MIYRLYAIRDIRSGFMSVTTDLNDATAKRNFEHAVFSQNSIMGTHPTDFSLFCIGEFDTDSGLINSFSAPEHITDARFKKGQKKVGDKYEF